MEDSSSAIPSHLSDVFEHHKRTSSIFGFKTETGWQMHVHIFPYTEVVVSTMLIYRMDQNLTSSRERQT